MSSPTQSRSCPENLPQTPRDFSADRGHAKRVAAAWALNCAAVSLFVAENGRAPKQRDSVEVDGQVVNVGRWLHKQFALDLPAAQLTELQEVLAGHPVTREQHRRDALSRLRDYMARWGEVPVKTQIVDDYPLGQWVHDQRKTYRAGRLAPQHITELEAVPGWTWTPLGDDFEAGIAALKQYMAQCPQAERWVPVRFVNSEGFRLGSWCRWARRNRDTLGPVKVQRLVALGFVWETPELAVRARMESQGTAEPSGRTRREVARFAADRDFTLLSVEADGV